MDKKKGYVYLFKYDNRFYKIGFSKCVEKRVKNVIPTILPFTPNVTIEHKISCLDKVLAERYLHQTFADKRYVGEWFVLDENDVEWIKSLNEEDLFDLIYS